MDQRRFCTGFHRFAHSWLHFTIRFGCLLARRPWTFLIVSGILSSYLISGLRFWQEINEESPSLWFPPGTTFYETGQWIKENFPNGVRYQQLLLSGSNILTPEYLKYVRQRYLLSNSICNLLGSEHFEYVVTTTTEFIFPYLGTIPTRYIRDVDPRKLKFEMRN